MQEEIWKDIQGYEGIYQVSSLGRIKSLERKIEYFNPLAGRLCVKTLKEKVMKTRLSRGGYCLISLHQSGEPMPITYAVHRLIAITFIENLHGKETVNHINGIKTDNRVSNLEWATFSENTQHAYDIGLAKSVIYKYTRRGEDCHKAKLTADQVINIRKERLDGKNITDLSKKYGVSFSLISQICRDEIWKHV